MNPIKYITYLWINLSMQFFFYSPSFSLSLTHIQHILRQHTYHQLKAQTRTHRSTVSTIFLINRQHVLLHLSQCQETHISVPVHWDYVKTNERRTRLLLREREKRTSLSLSLPLFFFRKNVLSSSPSYSHHHTVASRN